jgi:hypothetical protein
VKLRSVNQETPDIVAMGEIKPGQVGITLGTTHGGMLVACFGDDSAKVVVALDRKNMFWYTCIRDVTIPVQLYKPGTKLEFEV